MAKESKNSKKDPQKLAEAMRKNLLRRKTQKKQKEVKKDEN
jgi:hypothetical protein